LTPFFTREDVASAILWGRAHEAGWPLWRVWPPSMSRTLNVVAPTAWAARLEASRLVADMNRRFNLDLSTDPHSYGNWLHEKFAHDWCLMENGLGLVRRLVDGLYDDGPNPPTHYALVSR
jgi:hypothetical protein